MNVATVPPDFPPGSGGNRRLRRPPAAVVGDAVDWLPPLGAGLVAFAVYLVTLSRGVLGGDAGELQFVPPILGLTHPTGYPLQTLIHHIWGYVPIGSVAYRLNLLDAAIAAMTVGFVAAVVLRLGAGRAGAVAAGLSLAFGELWWSQAVRGDKYTLNGLFLVLTLWLFLRWRDAPTSSRLYWLAGVFGLSLAHHRSMLLVAPALLAGLILSHWQLRAPGQIIKLAALAACPLLLYAYVPWAGARGLPPGSWPVDTPIAFAEFLLDRGYTSALRPDAAFQGRLLEEAWVLVRSFGPLGALFGTAGLVLLVVRRRVECIVLLLAFLPQSILGASYLLESNYQFPRHWVFFLPGFVIWSVWVGVGFGAGLDWLSVRLARAGRLAPVAIVALTLLIQAGSAWVRGAITLVRAEAGAETMDNWRQDFQRSPVAQRFGRLALSVAEPDSIIVCDWEQATVLWYFQSVEGQRPDLEIVYPIERLRETLMRTAGTGQHVYISRTLSGVDALSVTSSNGPLIRVRAPPELSPVTQPARQDAPPFAGTRGVEPGAVAPHAEELHASFQGGLDLVSVTLHEPHISPGAVVPFTLWWTRRLAPLGQAPLTDDIAISVRLLGPDGAILATHDEGHAALGTSPFTRWPQGAIVGDYHELPVGSRLRPGQYKIQVIPYRVNPTQSLRVMSVSVKPSWHIEAVNEGVAIAIAVEPRTGRSPLDLLASLLAR